MLTESPKQNGNTVLSVKALPFRAVSQDETSKAAVGDVRTQGLKFSDVLSISLRVIPKHILYLIPPNYLFFYSTKAEKRLTNLRDWWKIKYDEAKS